MKSFITSETPTDNVPAVGNEKSLFDTGDSEAQHPDRSVDDESNDGEAISKEAQHGVQMIEATTTVWSTSHFILAYVIIWVIYFVDAMQSTVTSSMTPYVTSAFEAHSLTAATSIMSSIMGGVLQLPMAKVLDIWGRPQGFAVAVGFLTIGLIMMAGCNNVQTYAAAQVFYAVGYNTMSYTLSVFIADTSALKNRALMFGFVSSPYIATFKSGGPLRQVFCMAQVSDGDLVSFPSLPQWKAKKAGLMPTEESGRSFTESLKYYAIEFDVVGLFLIIGGLALFLLPFSLYSYQANGWKSATVICMIVFGGLLLIGFGFYEKYFAPKKYMPFELLVDRTVLGSCILAATLFVEFYVWDSYFSSFLQVVNGLSVTQTSYIVNIYSIGSCFWAVVVGAVIRITGRFKWLALYFGVPLTILGVGLMIHFRQPDVNIGYIIMCQIFIALSGGTLVICEEMAVMAATSHQYIAVVLAVQAMLANVGGAIGSTIASAIWTGVFPVKLAKYLPEEAQADLLSIYESIDVQLSYPVGTTIRAAIRRAYGDAQKDMLIGATAVLAIAVVSVAVWRDIRVKDFKQVKGRVV